MRIYQTDIRPRRRDARLRLPRIIGRHGEFTESHVGVVRDTARTSGCHSFCCNPSLQLRSGQACVGPASPLIHRCGWGNVKCLHPFTTIFA